MQCPASRGAHYLLLVTRLYNNEHIHSRPRYRNIHLAGAPPAQRSGEFDLMVGWRGQVCCLSCAQPAKAKTQHRISENTNSHTGKNAWWLKTSKNAAARTRDSAAPSATGRCSAKRRRGPAARRPQGKGGSPAAIWPAPPVRPSRREPPGPECASANPPSARAPPPPRRAQAWRLQARGGANLGGRAERA